MTKVFVVSTKHVGGDKPWQVQVLDMNKRVIEEKYFRSKDEVERFKEEKTRI